MHRITDYNKLSTEELYNQLALKNRGVAEYVYNRYAPAVYGEILRKVDNRKDADDILCQTFISFFQTPPNYLKPFPRIYLRLHSIATGIITKKGILYPFRSVVHFLPSQMYSRRSLNN